MAGRQDALCSGEEDLEELENESRFIFHEGMQSRH